MKLFNKLDEAASFVLSLNSGDLKIATPLGLGKANQLVNKIYDHFKWREKNRKLEIYSALSLDTPRFQSNLEKRLLAPFIERHYGADYPKLHYVEDQQTNVIPDHIKIHEFYFQAGQFSQVAKAQENYISLNYTHAARALADRGLQIIVQIIAKSSKSEGLPYSLSCNPDMTLDLVDLYREREKKLYVIGVVHPDLPFLGGDAAVDASFFDAVVETSEVRHQLFSFPRNPVDVTDHLIGLHASGLVEDGGTLQIGIGSLSDALVHSMIQRHEKNAVYQQALDTVGVGPKMCSPFTEGLYGTSEMLMDGFMHLREAKILKRFIFDQDEKKRRYLHAAFFLGSKNLYRWLRRLEGEDYDGLSMTRVSKVNDLYDEHEMALRRQRKKARFFNTCMQVHLLGGVVSDTLENGQVVSGVGGQYNFVAMSQELPDSHSVLMLRSTRTQKGKRISNIVTTNGQLTIARHLRDVVVTEYGVAQLKGKSDAEVVAALIEISDSAFQDGLIRWAQKNQKLPLNYILPQTARQNTPERNISFAQNYKSQNLFPEAPFGLDFEATEFKLIKALTSLKDKSRLSLLGLVLRGATTSKSQYPEEIKRMGLEQLRSIKDFFERYLVLAALKELDRNEGAIIR